MNTRNNSAFGKHNFIICLVAIILIVLGFVLMAGKGTTIDGGFEPDIFSTRRIVVAPTVSFIGFVLLIVGIMYPNQQVEK